MRKKIILLLATIMGLTLSITAFAESYGHGQFDQDRARIEEDKRIIDHDRERLRDANEAMQRDKQKLMEDQRQMESDRNRFSDHHHDQGYQGNVSVTRPTPPTPPTIPTH
jgi:hypothetical protein